jgi:hypothetical protein
MLSPQQVYPAIVVCLQALGVVAHRTAQAALADLVTALLVGQSLRTADLARALPSPQPRAARARYQRVADAWERRWLRSAALSPVLVRASLRLVRPAAPVLVLDSVRRGAWEVFTIGLVWHGRVLPLAWAVLPYPWPKGQFTPTVCALVRQVAQAWPPEWPLPHLVADRAFPSRALFCLLEAVGWAYTIRIKASDLVTLARGVVLGYDLIAAATRGAFTMAPGRFGRYTTLGRTHVVAGQDLPVLPHHQRDAGSARARTRRRAAKLSSVKQSRRAAPTEPWVLLVTTAATWLGAVRHYRLRYHTAGSYRDAQSGWDGRHGWNLGDQLAAATTATRVDAVVGLWALGTLVQAGVGDHLTAAPTPAAIQAVAGEWTVHGRLSVWARGHFAFTEPHGRLGPWLLATLHGLAERVGTGTATTTLPAPRRPRPPRRPSRQWSASGSVAA